MHTIRSPWKSNKLGEAIQAIVSGFHVWIGKCNFGTKERKRVDHVYQYECKKNLKVKVKFLFSYLLLIIFFGCNCWKLLLTAWFQIFPSLISTRSIFIFFVFVSWAFFLSILEYLITKWLHLFAKPRLCTHFPLLSQLTSVLILEISFLLHVKLMVCAYMYSDFAVLSTNLWLINMFSWLVGGSISGQDWYISCELCTRVAIRSW